MNSQLHLGNDQILLLPLQECHFEFLLPIAIKHPDLLQYSPSPFGTVESLKQYINMAIKSRKKGQRYPFAIFDKFSQCFVGSTSFGNFSKADKHLEIGWTWISKEFQGTGINQQCKFLMLNQAFDQWEMERVEFRIDERNNQSRKAIEKIGGIYEGCMRNHTVMQNGFKRNTVLYSILRKEWEELKTGMIFSSYMNNNNQDLYEIQKGNL